LGDPVGHYGGGVPDTHTHTHTPLYGYGLITGPNEGLSLWLASNRSSPESQQQQRRRPSLSSRLIRHDWSHEITTLAKPRCAQTTVVGAMPLSLLMPTRRYPRSATAGVCVLASCTVCWPKSTIETLHFDMTRPLALLHNTIKSIVML